MDKENTSKPHTQLVDYRQSVVNHSKLPDCDAHDWTKIPDHQAYWLSGFVKPEDIVVDFFSGWGTTAFLCKMFGFNYIAFEIEPDVAEMARERVLNTQPPLFVLEPEQTEMELNDA